MLVIGLVRRTQTSVLALLLRDIGSEDVSLGAALANHYNGVRDARHTMIDF